MKRAHLLILIGLLLVIAPASSLFAQDAPTPMPTPILDSLNTFTSGSRFLVRVNTDSLNVHRFPSDNADRVASLFKGDIVQAVGRSLDGSWFEVRRIGRMNNLGWVVNTLIDWDFLPETLPLGDIRTGITGPVTLASAPPIGLYLLQAPILRELPLRTGRRIMALPPLIVIPVIARNRDTTWLQVNYFGYQGWINRASIRERGDIDLNTLPVPPGIPEPDTVPVIVIPLEIQQAQIDRLRSYINDRETLAIGLEAFWWGVYRGEIMPCNAPPEIANYPYTDEDIRELPELARYVPRLTDALNYLTTARNPLLRCGIIGPSTAVDARNSAINARVIFDATLQTLGNLEKTLNESH
ncbi:MAG: SH3 domain-containing protein [Chloroflexota bacterium]